MLKVTLFASFLLLVFALEHAESCSSSPPTDVKDTTTDPPWCKDKNMKECKLDITKKSCPNHCKKLTRFEK